MVFYTNQIRFVFLSLYLVLVLNGCRTVPEKEIKTKNVIQKMKRKLSHDGKIIHHEQKKPGWSYTGNTGPEYWSSIKKEYACCNGKFQSPVDIKASFYDPVMPDLQLNFSDNRELKLLNTGNTLQFNCDVGCGIKYGNTEYELIQFHFHCPSEHHVNGKSYAMEIHFVLANKEKMVVVAVFVTEGYDNPFFELLIDYLPEKVGMEVTKDVSCNINELIPVDKSYYKYPGSLTTPPCTENVEWFVLKTPVKGSAEQIKLLSEVMPLENARPLQPLNGRLIKDK